ncbi:MAG: hypothetical protein WCO84_03205 [bacterium]
MKLETINVDYHFHPNLPKNDKKAIKKIKKIYDKFQRANINAVIVTEHIYKDYVRSWNLMKEHKPENFFIFPGIEYVTSENLDIIIFSKDEEIFNLNLKPFKISYEETVKLIKNNDKLFGFITHPLTLGWTSIINKKGLPFEKKMANELKSIEKKYIVYSKLKKFLNIPILKNIFHNTLLKIKRGENLPSAYYPTDVRFFATGSDAHNTWEIGNYAEVKIQKGDIFYSIINNEYLKTHYKPDRTNIIQDIKSLSTVFFEWCAKRYYLFTNK